MINRSASRLAAGGAVAQIAGEHGLSGLQPPGHPLADEHAVCGQGVVGIDVLPVSGLALVALQGESPPTGALRLLAFPAGAAFFCGRDAEFGGGFRRRRGRRLILREPLFKLLPMGLKLLDLPLTTSGDVRGGLELLDNLEHPLWVGTSTSSVCFQLLQIHSHRLPDSAHFMQERFSRNGQVQTNHGAIKTGDPDIDEDKNAKDSIIYRIDKEVAHPLGHETSTLFRISKFKYWGRKFLKACET